MVYFYDHKDLFRLTSDDRHILSASDDTNSILWDIESGEVIF